MENMRKQIEKILITFQLHYEKLVSTFLKDRDCSNLIPIYEILQKYSLNPGKNLRPLLLIFSYLSFSRNKDLDKIPIEIWKAAAYLELFNCFALGLDDIFDQSYLRRGRPALHVQIGNLFKDKWKGQTLTTLNIIDLFLWMQEQWLILHLPLHGYRRNLQELLRTMIRTTIQGECRDIIYSGKISDRTDKWPNEDEILEIYWKKSVVYAIWFPLTYGAIYSQMSKEILNLLRKFSFTFGLAFQIHDDLLIMRSESEIGKPVIDDLKEGKKTLIALKARELASLEDLELIDRFWSNPDISMSNLEEFKQIFIRSGALDYCRMKISTLLDEAKAAIKQIGDSGYQIEWLEYFLCQGLPWMDDLRT